MLFDPLHLCPVLGAAIAWLFNLTKNYCIALVLFTLLIRVVLFPLAVKNQKAVAGQSKLISKQKEIKERYKGDREKQSQELIKLNESEQVSIFGGCFSSFLPMLIFLSMSKTMYAPLTHILHIDEEKIRQATSIVASERGGDQKPSLYDEMKVVENFPNNRGKFSMFDKEDSEKIETLSFNLNFFGTSLLRAPRESPVLWIIPVFSVLTSIFSYHISMKFRQIPTQSTQGCAKYSMYPLMAFSAFITFGFPAICGVYFALSSFVEIFQRFILEKFYGIYKINALREAARIQRRILEEKKLKPFK
ncbi:MAG: YidC/Oxa1 family membrane protein insertase [Oscillospiraceae bacterium]|jgi:YidC/Oxa1 family membrane protein insertase|nr:YidC/Oxa1 family membrane protein insertase [Oscillospiraceae bacterium]